jgi:hypothetical protein
MWIIDPTQSRPDLRQPARVPKQEVDPKQRMDLSGRVCLLSNSKPNAGALLEAIADRLDLVDAALLAKPTSSMPAPDELLEAVAANFEGALVAIAD